MLQQAWQDIDSFVEAYERAWRNGGDPQISEFVPNRGHPMYRDVLIELARVDLELRWESSRPLPLEHYFGQFHEIREDDAAVNQLAFEEYRLRRQSGEPANAEEYVKRYQVSIENWNTRSSQNGITPSAAQQVSNLSSVTSCQRQLPQAMDSADLARRFPGFHILRELGRGAFSQVYLARQLDLANRLVVLKVTSESFAEADKMAQLQHAHIVPTYSVHRAGDLYAVCMPFFGETTLADLVGRLHDSQVLPETGHIVAETVAARSLSTCLRTRSTPTSLWPGVTTVSPSSQKSGDPAVSDAELFLKRLRGLSYVDAILLLGKRLADGLAHAHERGIIHRDLKPANILLADDGRPMLLDFNLSEDLKPGAPGADPLVGGTLPYMAPEQLESFQHGTSARDRRSDIYSLGVILYELLTGRHPFPPRSGAVDSVLVEMLTDRQQLPASVHKLNRSASPAVAVIIARCLEADPRRRYQQAADLNEDIESHLRSEPLKHTGEPSLRERAQKWTRRHPRLTSVATIGAVAAAIVFSARAYHENARITALRKDVSELMRAGKQAFDANELHLAQGRFQSAWMKVQSEPALVEYQPGVAGWLDHSRHAAVEEQWKRRVPPQDYESCRDEALLLSVLPDSIQHPQLAAHEAVRAALALTQPGDPGWGDDREQLTLLQATLIAAESTPREALAFFAKNQEFTSRLFLTRRADLLEQVGRATEARDLRLHAQGLPWRKSEAQLFAGLDHLRNHRPEQASAEFEQMLEADPNHFTARILQGLCFVKLSRPGEAKVALTACIAQRPHFPWSYYLRSQANEALSAPGPAAADLRRTLELNPSDHLKQAVTARLQKLAAGASKVSTAN